MNKLLKFSWGHIFYLLALTTIWYLSFNGLTFLMNEGGAFNFLDNGGTAFNHWTWIIPSIIVLILGFYFAFLQWIKSADGNFARNIWIERILLLLSPIVLLAFLSLALHFFSVYAQEDKIERSLTSMIESSKSIYDDYEKYSNDRIELYKKTLADVAQNPKSTKYQSMDFVGGIEAVQQNNRIEALRLQLYPKAYIQIKDQSNRYVQGIRTNASVWNVALFGNLNTIKASILNWAKVLEDLSSHISNYEKTAYDGAKQFKASESVNASFGLLTEVQTCYITWSIFSAWGVFFFFLTWLCLLMPYLVQDRFTRNHFSLFKRKPKAIVIPKIDDPYAPFIL